MLLAGTDLAADDTAWVMDDTPPITSVPGLFNR